MSTLLPARRTLPFSAEALAIVGPFAPPVVVRLPPPELLAGSSAWAAFVAQLGDHRTKGCGCTAASTR